MENFVSKLKLIFGDSILRRRIVVTCVALIIFRLLSSIPISGVNIAQLEAFLSNSQFLGLLNVFSGGGLSNLSIVMLGVGPYINASIIMQLLTMVWPRLKALYQEEGEAGRAKFAQYSRWLGAPLAFLQAFGFLILLQKQGVVPFLGGFDFAMNVCVIAAGSLLLMWIGELITQYGIGNGVSLIIFAGIVAQIPTAISQEALASFGDPTRLPLYIGIILATFAVIYAVVVVTEAERPIPVTYAKRVRGMKVYGGVSTYLPLRLNQAGVIPIIFALSILLFPQMIFNFLAGSANVTINAIGTFATALLANQIVYAVMYFILVFLFTYFYTAVTFDPDQISENLQKNGAFIPGVRPGKNTSEHISKTLTRLTFVGAIFLGLIAILPLIMQGITGITSFAIGGTALLIVVSVVLDLMKKVDAQVSMREY